MDNKNAAKNAFIYYPYSQDYEIFTILSNSTFLGRTLFRLWNIIFQGEYEEANKTHFGRDVQVVVAFGKEIQGHTPLTFSNEKRMKNVMKLLPPRWIGVKEVIHNILPIEAGSLFSSMDLASIPQLHAKNRSNAPWTFVQTSNCKSDAVLAQWSRLDRPKQARFRN